MSEIPSDWSPDALLLFVGVFTALSAGASIFLAEIWSQKMRQRREHFKIWQDRRLKIWQEQQRESFLRLERTAKKAQSEVNQGPTIMRTITRKIGHCRCMKEWMISGVRALANRHPMMPCAILKGSRDKRIAACPVSTGMPAIIEASIRAASAALVLPEFTMPRFRRVDSALSLVQVPQEECECITPSPR
jgi:hypothetical protein